MGRLTVKRFPFPIHFLNFVSYFRRSKVLYRQYKIMDTRKVFGDLHLVIVAELHGEGPPALGHGPE
jgi:hypothetical protein